MSSYLFLTLAAFFSVFTCDSITEYAESLSERKPREEFCAFTLNLTILRTIIPDAFSQIVMQV